MSESFSSREQQPSKTKRPGPFETVWALLPRSHKLLVLEGSTLASDAIERLVDNDFSQLLRRFGDRLRYDRELYSNLASTDAKVPT